MYDPDNPAFLIGWLPKAHALFVTVEGGDIVMSFQGLVQYERPLGIVTLCSAPGPDHARYGPGVTHMAYTYSKRTGLKYMFGALNNALNPYCEDFAGTSLSIYGARVTRDNSFDQPYYFLNNAPPDMAALKPVHIRD